MEKPIGEDFIHEALDRAHIASSHLQMALGEHEVVQKMPDVREAYEKAVEALEDLYQLIGSK
ncbi:hypothetical protein [Pelagicoccus mobilis]|uniref:Uncharacterized protein n=1 Tax=Pelagicoccus mobilis TaxID=415221 RepID=A0A934RUA4_9BACT|nr:hypothetical protein [Pelagicoccus mobilis]MBK1876992.1 hypothetical protein [Pelagicoccus mobilis]